MKKHKIFLISLLFLCLMSACAAADDISVVLNGRFLTFDVPAQTVDGRTLVPMRAIFTELGAEVTWDDLTLTAVAVKDETEIEVTIGEAAIKINGNTVILDVPPQIIDGRTLVPVRAVAEGFSCFVRWDARTKTVHISENSVMTVHYIDVGQGSAAFIELPGGKTMLIDAGSRNQGRNVVSYINNYSKRIDYLIASHPHEDHIGGMVEVINNFDIGAIYMPRVSHDTKTFENLLTAIRDKGMTVNTARAGVSIIDENGLKIDFLAPVGDSYANLNNHSAVVKITNQSNSFLFMGDAEEQSERDITANVKADVIKIGHHGSGTSTSQSFIERVRPKYAVISVGGNNTYGHPHSRVIDRLNDLGVIIYRTDEIGTIVLTCDGVDIIRN